MDVLAKMKLQRDLARKQRQLILNDLDQILLDHEDTHGPCRVKHACREEIDACLYHRLTALLSKCRKG